MKRAGLIAVSLVAALALAGCAAQFEGSGSKDAASAEQLALHLDDPWDEPIQQTATKAEGNLADGTYTGRGHGVDGIITVTIQVKDNVVTTTEITQEGETQSVGGFEAIRDGKYAEMIDAAQGSGFDTIAGATLTSLAIREAVDDCLAQAAK